MHVAKGSWQFNYRLGFVVDFLSHATIVGFMGGAATVVCLQQLKGILGLVRFTHATDLQSVMRSVFSQTNQVCFFTYTIYFSSCLVDINYIFLKKVMILFQFN